MPRLIPPELGNGKRPSDPTYDQGSIPILDVSEETHDLVGAAHDAALDPEDDTTLLTGVVVILDNPRPFDSPTTPDRTIISVGGSTLHEAATEIIGTFSVHALDAPTWVASSSDELAQVIAEHYTVKGYSICKVLDMNDIPKGG